MHFHIETDHIIIGHASRAVYYIIKMLACINIDVWLWDGVLSGFNYSSTEGLAEGRR